MVSQGTAYADENWLRLWRENRRAASSGGEPAPKILLFGPSAHFAAQPWLEEGLADAALSGEPKEPSRKLSRACWPAP